MFNYTVIIPHKNCVPLLLRCMDSIPDREDIQVVVVDDVSTLSSEERIQMEALRSDRIQVLFLKKSHYAGGARNEGLAIAEGRWLVFADADDFFTEHAFEVMDSWIDSQMDMVFFCHESRMSNTLKPTPRSSERNDYVLQLAHNASDTHAEENLRYLNPVPWARMVRRELVETHQLKFDCILAANDVMFAIMAGYYACQVAADSRVVYCVTVREASLTRTKSKEVIDCRYAVAERRTQFFQEHGLHTMTQWLARRVWQELRSNGFSAFLRYYKLARLYHVNIWRGLFRSVVC